MVLVEATFATLVTLIAAAQCKTGGNIFDRGTYTASCCEFSEKELLSITTDQEICQPSNSGYIYQSSDTRCFKCPPNLCYVLDGGFWLDQFCMCPKRFVDFAKNGAFVGGRGSVDDVLEGCKTSHEIRWPGSVGKSEREIKACKGCTPQKTATPSADLTVKLSPSPSVTTTSQPDSTTPPPLKPSADDSKISKEIVAAIISAVATVIAAIIGVLWVRRRRGI